VVVAAPRVLLDTNVWVSAVIYLAGAPARVLEAFQADRFVPGASRALFDGIHEVPYRTHIRRRWQLGDAEVASVLALLRTGQSRSFIGECLERL
jgi:predicted nucleic acid-binding protein